MEMDKLETWVWSSSTTMSKHSNLLRSLERILVARNGRHSDCVCGARHDSLASHRVGSYYVWCELGCHVVVFECDIVSLCRESLERKNKTHIPQNRYSKITSVSIDDGALVTGDSNGLVLS